MSARILSASFDVKLVNGVLSGAVSAGFPSPAVDYAEEPIDLLKFIAPHPTATYYVQALGDSMEDAHIPAGAILVVDKSVEPANGDIVVAYLNGGYTVKFLERKKGSCRLRSANAKKNYPPIQITEDMNAVVWGVVSAVIINHHYAKHVRPH